jgi:uncharacterized protein
MTWQIAWALILGFALSGAVQAVVSKREMVRLLPDHSPRTLAVTCGLGAASSSCSYAAVALARSILRKGADFTAAMAFELASTNLVVELGILLAVLLGWQFTAAEFLGAPLMVAIMALLFGRLLGPRLLAEARHEADQGRRGSREGHADMAAAGEAVRDMSVTSGSLWRRVTAAAGFSAIALCFVMNWAAVWKDIAGGLLLAGMLGAWVPDDDFWRSLFLTSDPLLAALWGPLVGPLVAIISFVCSVGNLPLAAILWNGGISFGGVIAFIFADLIILPILGIYRRYYGGRMSLLILGVFYVAMVGASWAVEAIFRALGLVPTEPTPGWSRPASPSTTRRY